MLRSSTITILASALLFGACGKPSWDAAAALPVSVPREWWPQGLEERNGWSPDELHEVRAALYLVWLTLPGDDPRRDLLLEATYLPLEPGEVRYPGESRFRLGRTTLGTCEVVCGRPGNLNPATLALVISHELFHLAHDRIVLQSRTESDASELQAHRQSVQDCERFEHVLPPSGGWREQVRFERANAVLMSSLYEVRFRVMQLVDRIGVAIDPAPGTALDRLLTATVERDRGDFDLGLEADREVLDQLESVILSVQPVDVEGLRLIRLARNSIDAVAPAESGVRWTHAQLGRM